MQQNNQLTEQEKDYLLELISSLNKSRINQTFEGSNNEVTNIFLDTSQIFLILKGLSMTTIGNKELNLQEYKSIFIYMKNLIIMYQRNIKYSDINDIIKKLILILLDPNIEFIHYDNMSLMFLQLIKIICDNDNELIKDSSTNENFFKIILDKVSQNNYKKEDFLIIEKNSLMTYICLFDTNIIKEKNFLDLIKKYIVPSCDIIFNKTGLYIIPFVLYDAEFITVLKCLYDLLISCLKKMKRFFPSIKRKEISDNLFIKYGRYSLDLIKLIPNLKKDEDSLNNILVFKEEYKEFNIMKSTIFLFLFCVVENSMNSLSNEIDSDSLNIIYQILKLVVEAFKQILDNEKIFFNLRKIDDEEKDEEEEEYFNILLYNMIYFLCKSIIKEPIKSEFNKNIQIFLLNILFPLLVTVESEDKYMKNDPEKYCTYLNDLLYNLTLKNFRIAGFILIKKICDNFEDVPNFIFSFIIGMMEDLLVPKTNINYEVNNNSDIKYNTYLYYKSQNILLSKFNDETKLDFCLLILILLQDNLLKYNILKNRLREILIKSQNKLGEIKNNLIKIKLCHFFKFAIPKLFNIESYESKDNCLNENSINEKNKQNIAFIEIALTFLFNNLKQKNNKLDDNKYLSSDALRNEASVIIIYLCKYNQEENNILNSGINFLFQKEFESLIPLIENIQMYSFFSVIEQIIKNVKIINRDYIFTCLEKLTKRFHVEFQRGDNNSQLYCPLYFSIISNFFNGVNKININETKFPEEFTKFNNLFQTIFDYLNDINSFIYYENLIKSMTEYIKNYQGINDQISHLINIMPIVIERDRQLSEDNFHYLSAFLTYFQFNSLIIDSSQDKLFDLIIKILETGFSYEFGSYDSSKLFSLLITLQIYNKNMNISNDYLKILLLNTIKCFNYIFQEDENYGNLKMKVDKNNIIFGILSLGYIFKPEETFNLLNEAEIMVNKQKNFYGEFDYEKFNFNIYVEILNYINKYQIENELLRKCLILGFCSIIKNENLRMFLDKNKNIKLKLVLIFANFILEHKKAEINKRNKIVKNELNYSEIKINEDGKINFKDTSDSEGEEDEDEEIIQNKLNIDINFILEQNKNIKNSDEYQFFKETLDNLKQTDIECINLLNKELDKDKLNQLEDIYHMKKIKVNYQGKEFEIPRKIVNIKKNL